MIVEAGSRKGSQSTRSSKVDEKVNNAKAETVANSWVSSVRFVEDAKMNGLMRWRGMWNVQESEVTNVSTAQHREAEQSRRQLEKGLGIKVDPSFFPQIAVKDFAPGESQNGWTSIKR